MAVSKRLRYEILTRDGEACRKCGRRAPEVELQIDHIIPVALGGSDDPSNLQTLCRDCNAGKASMPAVLICNEPDGRAHRQRSQPITHG
ncbi:HNH endonuclease [Mycolicibacterium fluoranthenivorans]|uniref:HNH endonuclease n=1 Tax=Mycolicibacterium fluoranthenivorans TaxID=258505 RepID=UPI0014226981|nr:HNH endonuclease [Mycolicibacterium fluoranthenivorans]